MSKTKDQSMKMTRRNVFIFDDDYSLADTLVGKYKLPNKALLIRETIARNLEKTAREIGRV